MGNSYSTYLSQLSPIPANICVLHVESGTMYGINCPEEMVQGIIHIYKEVFNKDIKIEAWCPQIIKFVYHTRITLFLKSLPMRRMFCRIQKLCYQSGWRLVSSPVLTYNYSLSTWFYEKVINSGDNENSNISNEFCVVGLSDFDRIQFVDFPKALENGIIECIRQNWTRGIQNIEIEKTDNVWSVKLRGNPWYCDVEQSLDGRYLVLCLIRFMYLYNWRLVNSTKIHYNASETMFFRYVGNSPNMDIPHSLPDCHFMVALMNHSYFYVLGGDDSIANVIAGSCHKYETAGVELNQYENNHRCVKLRSHIWSRYNSDEMSTRKLITFLLQDFALYGWLPLESTSCSKMIDDLSTITFVRSFPARLMYFCLCIRQFQSICLVNAIDEVQNTVFNIFCQYYPIKREFIKRSNYGVALSIDFEGNPFRSDSKGTLLFQRALAVIIDALRNIGWNLVLKAITSDEIFVQNLPTTTLTQTNAPNSIYGNVNNQHNTHVANEGTKVKWSTSGLWFSKALTY